VPAVTDPLRVERSQLFREIGYLENQKRSLFVFSEIDGIVGAVNFKAGEKAPAFASLITISPVNPTYIVGYVHESAHSKLSPKQRVKVISAASGQEIYGEVANVGARIVQIPERLLRISTIVSYGREVLVRIPEENGFLLSEKVQIKPVYTLDMFPIAKAENESENKKPEFIDISLPYEMTIGELFQPSGLVWISDLNSFVVASDESLTGGQPSLILVHKDGTVSGQTLPIQNLSGIDDVESISVDGNTIYIMASLGNTKRGERVNDREIFARISREGLVLKATAAVNLRRALEPALQNSPDSRLRTIGSMAEQGVINVEGHEVRGGDLYIALKVPQLQRGTGMILRIRNVNAILSGQPVAPENVSIHSELKFKTEKTGFSMQIADLIMTDQGMFVATTCQGEACSALWAAGDGRSEKPRLLAFFKRRQLEGLAYDASSSTITGIFDQNGKPTQLMRLKLK
ncbi:MAG TPA: hypothetical protein VM432_04640, partial [Bdellovibrionales bacterium]|nr:hypothetical protein [Bdellovibrionales bacterium]